MRTLLAILITLASVEASGQAKQTVGPVTGVKYVLTAEVACVRLPACAVEVSIVDTLPEAKLIASHVSHDGFWHDSPNEDDEVRGVFYAPAAIRRVSVKRIFY